MYNRGPLRLRVASRRLRGRGKVSRASGADMASCDGDVTQWSWERSGKQRSSPAALFVLIRCRSLSPHPSADV